MTEPIISKSEMKRLCALDPQKAADELMRLRAERDYLIDLIGRMRAQWLGSWAEAECLRITGQSPSYSHEALDVKDEAGQ